MKSIIYHHRTRAKGAEGVHIDGVQKAFKKKGYLVFDISIYKSKKECEYQSKQKITGKQSSSLMRRVYNFIASKLPNILFKILELLYNFRCYIEADKIIKSILKRGENIDFIYERYAYFCFALVLISKKYSIPLILEANTTSYINDVRKLHLKNTARKIEKHIFNNCSLIVTVSNYLKREIILKYNIEAEKIVVTPNAISKSDFIGNDNFNDSRLLFEAEKFARHSIVIGFVGVFVSWHGLDFLIDIFYQLTVDNDSKLPIKLLLVGDGPTKKDILSLIDTLNLTEQVFFTGMVSHQDIKSYIDLFDIAIMPDSNSFGSPMKIFEYMAMGKAVVAPDYEPISDIIKHRHNGMIFGHRKCIDCIGVLKELIGDYNLRILVGENAKTDVFNKHTWDKNIEKILFHFFKTRGGTYETDKVYD